MTEEIGLQVARAGNVVFDDTNERILSHKDIGYVYGVFINTLVKEMDCDTQSNREEIMKLLCDFEVNVKGNLKRYTADRGREAYEASITIQTEIKRFANKLYQSFNKSNRMFADIMVRTTIHKFKKVLELKMYVANLQTKECNV